MADGASLGAPVGSGVAGVGAAVGGADGLDVGTAVVGMDDGIGEGADVGTPVGSDVGARDGIEDGSDEFVDVDLDGLDDRYEDDIVDANNDGLDDNIVELTAGYKFKDTRKYDIEIEIADDVVTGETKTTIQSTCEGTGCPLAYGAKCVVKGEFEGVIIEDAQVDVSLGAPTDDTGSSASASQGD